jgi:hypothetical protein
MIMRASSWIRVGLLVACVAGVVPAASAQTAGVRAGVSVDPDQFFVGGHVETERLVDRVYLRPNVEVGFGDDLTTIALNIEAVYKIPLDRTQWTFYAGGGPGVNFYRFDGGGSNSQAGLNLLAGLEHDRGFFFEVKGGAWDSPDLKFTAGYAFRRR